jgi:hypothetical protein
MCYENVFKVFGKQWNFFTKKQKTLETPTSDVYAKICMVVVVYTW